MGASWPGRHLTSLRSLVSCRSTPESRTALQGRNERGKGAQLPGLRITMGAPKIPTVSQVHSSIQYKDLRFEHGGAKVASWTGCHLSSLRPCCTGSILETGFWLCKLPKSCVSYRFSIAFLFSLLLFFSKLPSSINNELVKKQIYLYFRQLQNCANESDSVCDCWAIHMREKSIVTKE